MKRQNIYKLFNLLLSVFYCLVLGISHSFANTTNDSTVNTNYQKACEDSNFTSNYQKLESTLFTLYKLGYRQMPVDMQKLLLAKVQNANSSQPVTHNPQLLNSNSQFIFSQIDNRIEYYTLSNNTFPEIFQTNNLVAIGNTTIDIQSHKICNINITNNTKIIDPIAFALSIDQLAAKFPDVSPYSSMDNNPINKIDPDGKAPVKYMPNCTVDASGNPISCSNGERMAVTYEEVEKVFRDNGVTNIHEANALFGSAFAAIHPWFGKATVSDKFIYTKHGGWVDIKHFTSAASMQQSVGYYAANALGTSNELFQGAQASNISAKSYEDYPSNELGYQFGDNFGDLEGEEFYSALHDYFEYLGTTTPESAPNYLDVPNDNIELYDVLGENNPRNSTSTPMYTTDGSYNEDMEQFYSDMNDIREGITGEIPESSTEDNGDWE